MLGCSCTVHIKFGFLCRIQPGMPHDVVESIARRSGRTLLPVVLLLLPRIDTPVRAAHAVDCLGATVSNLETVSLGNRLIAHQTQLDVAPAVHHLTQSASTLLPTRTSMPTCSDSPSCSSWSDETDELSLDESSSDEPVSDELASFSNSVGMHCACTTCYRRQDGASGCGASCIRTACAAGSFHLVLLKVL